MADPNGDEKNSSTKDKLKSPFHDLKEKLEGTHLHNLKVNLTHQKYGYHNQTLMPLSWP